MYKLSPILEETKSQLEFENRNENILFIIICYPFYLFNLFIDCLKGINDLDFEDDYFN